LREFCLGRLAKFKVPKDVFFTGSLPRNPSGKVLKRVLREDVRNRSEGRSSSRDPTHG
jgi:acyl-CoA synthetase (AMP-forming)/AMP-acid ligase II